MLDTDEFIEQILMKAIPDIDEKELETMIEETQPVFYDRVISHVAKQIDPKEGKNILKILETEGVTPEVATYVKINIPNFSEFLKKTYDDFETMYLKQFKSFEKEFPPEEEA